MTQHTLLFLIDGMRPDGLQQAHTPALDALMARGAWTLEATTVMPSITLPCIMSLFQSAPPDRHGVTTNLFTPNSVQTGLFEVVSAAGRTTASFYNWEQLRDLSRPGALRVSLFLDNDKEPAGAGDTELTRRAIVALQAHPVDFAFIYLGHTDAAGHDHGWMSAPYIAAIENADRCIDLAIRALPAWNVVVTADHGGHGTGHGMDLAEDMTIPLVMGGPAVEARGRLTGPAGIIDVAPTIAGWMGIAPPSTWLGRSLLEP